MHGLGNEGKVGLIWTIDRMCGWSCAHCCVDAESVSRRGDKIFVNSNHGNFSFLNENNGSIYEQAQRELIVRGRALTKDQKLHIVENLKGVDVEVGLSGGDLLLNPDNIEVLKMLSNQIDGKNNIGLTTTNLGLRMAKIDDWLPFVAQVEVTYDSPVERDPNHQQNGYNSANFKALCDLNNQCKRRGVNIKALVPISKLHTDPKIVDELYSDLTKSGVPYVYLMRTLPVGRANDFTDKPLSADELRTVINNFKQQKTNGPELQLMCALKPLFPSEYPGNSCSVGKTTVDITSSGELIIDAFAYNSRGDALFPEAILGNLTTTSLKEIISRPEVQKISLLNNKNQGHCRIASFLNGSVNDDNITKFFGPNDPLYQ
jgi:sulfatase maturation enzyme AslB (radical SAM superfamily)